MTAIGGIALVTGLEEGRFPLEMLRRTPPFGTYVIPGIILAGVVGGSATVAAAATLLSPRADALASTVAGVGMMGCIAGFVRGASRV